MPEPQPGSQEASPGTTGLSLTLLSSLPMNTINSGGQFDNRGYSTKVIYSDSDEDCVSGGEKAQQAQTGKR